MPDIEAIYQLGRTVSSIETKVESLVDLVKEKSERDSKYFEAVFKNIGDTKENVTKIMVRQEGMDERAYAHFKTDDEKFKEIDGLANDVEELKKDKWKMQGISSFISLVVGGLSALGITLTFKGH